MAPRLVVKVTRVPLCGAVPDASITCASNCVVPLTGSAVAEAVSVIVDPLGASNGTRVQVIASSDDTDQEGGSRERTAEA